MRKNNSENTVIQMPKVREFDIHTTEEAENIHEFAIENALYLATSLEQLIHLLQDNDKERAVIAYSSRICEAYCSGLQDGYERAKKELEANQVKENEVAKLLDAIKDA